MNQPSKKVAIIDFVVINNKVMSAAAGITRKGAATLYNKGFFPKKGGTVTAYSSFGQIAKKSKLYKSQKIVEDELIDIRIPEEVE